MTSESPTHPDAPRAGGETPPMERVTALLDEYAAEVHEDAIYESRAEHVKRTRQALLDEIAAGDGEQRWLIGFAVGGPKWVAGLRERERVYGGGISRSTAHAHMEPVETIDTNEAIQFARERDARAFLESLEYPYRGILRIEEHLWLDAKAHGSMDTLYPDTVRGT